MKGLLLVYPRSGSHFIMRILTGVPEMIDVYLRTPKKADACIEECELSIYPEKHLSSSDKDNHLFIQYAFETRPDRSVPEFASLYSLEDVRSLPDDWKIVYLVRDGRDQIESYWHMVYKSALHRGQKHKRYDNDNLRYLCQIFKQRARRIIECSDSLENYTFYRFEDLIANPIEVSSSIISFLGFTPDIDSISKTVESIIPNSSYSSVKKVTRRKDIWTDEQNDIFWSVAGDEALQLGYER